MDGAFEGQTGWPVGGQPDAREIGQLSTLKNSQPVDLALFGRLNLARDLLTRSYGLCSFYARLSGPSSDRTSFPGVRRSTRIHAYFINTLVRISSNKIDVFRRYP